MLNRIWERIGLGRERSEVYPFGTYGFGPDRSAGEEPPSEDATPAAVLDDTATSAVIDTERPVTSLEQAQSGNPSMRTGPTAAREGKVVPFEARKPRQTPEHWAFMWAVAAATVATATVIGMTYRHRRTR